MLGRPLLSWTLEALAAAPLEALDIVVREWILCARMEEFDLITGAVPANLGPVRLVEGGLTRQDSVYAGVRQATSDFVMVHDAARPCLSADTIMRVVQAALEHGAAIAALQVLDTVKRADKSGVFSAETLDRRTIWLAQTPQVFRRTLLLAALESAAREEFQGTDCASLLERRGQGVALVEGEAANFKVTYATDLARAESLLRERNS